MMPNTDPKILAHIIETRDLLDTARRELGRMVDTSTVLDSNLRHVLTRMAAAFGENVQSTERLLANAQVGE